jgi:hypothetical protein
MGVSMVLAAGLAAWRTATDLSPDDTLNEMYVRYILIGGSHALHMAYKNPLTDEVPNAVSVQMFAPFQTILRLEAEYGSVMPETLYLMSLCRCCTRTLHSA